MLFDLQRQMSMEKSMKHGFILGGNLMKGSVRAMTYLII